MLPNVKEFIICKNKFLKKKSHLHIIKLHIIQTKVTRKYYLKNGMVKD